jgi:glucokinase
LFAAVDIGATNIRVASGDENGLELKFQEQTDRLHGSAGVSKQIARLIKQLKIEPEAIGIGSIGPLNIREGAIINTPNYPFKNIPIVNPLHEEFGIPVKLLNDCAAAVIGERRFGAGRGLENIFYVTISTGLGGGAIVDGNLLKGKDGNAPEIGHIVIYPGSEIVCGCGCKGHWEAFSSGSNIPRYARYIVEKQGITESDLFSVAGPDLSGLTAEKLYSVALKGDRAADMIVNEIGEVNAVGFADIVNAFDPELITVGGSVVLNNVDLILNPIREKIGKYLINRCPEIMVTPLGGEAVLLGALTACLT